MTHGKILKARIKKFQVMFCRNNHIFTCFTNQSKPGNRSENEAIAATVEINTEGCLRKHEKAHVASSDQT